MRTSRRTQPQPLNLKFSLSVYWKDAILKFLKRIFTWWNSQTLGTMIFTWREGVFVGSDELGNSYYQSKDSSRRWVIFKNSMDASLVSADWHGWLHHTVSSTPNNQKSLRKVWEKPHQENKTGSQLAYHPLGQNRLKTKNYADYEAWSPENDS